MTRNAEEIVNQSLKVRTVPHARSGDGTGHVAILMAMHNGAATLGAQLESFLGQSHDDWSLIVSDDRSRDDSVDRIRAFAACSGRSVSLLPGPGLGFAQNFLHLIRAAGPYVPFAALSDQDDVWLPGKLSRALQHLQAVPEGRPALYSGRTVICDAALKPLRRSPEFTLPPGFRNALVQSIGGGNTMVMNRAALDLAQETARHARGIVAHDWWLYQIVTGAGGQVFHDPEPMVLYRQHAGNLIGANDTALASLSRLVLVLRGRFRGWNTANLRALEAASHWLTPEAREVLGAFRSLRSRSPAMRLRALKALGLYRQTRRGNIALAIAALLNRL
jgi:glycosyltransferase involved in cell wall biosynthesis